MSSLGAASYAYKPNKNLADYEKSYKPAKFHDNLGHYNNSIKAANDISNKITPEDSYLSIAQRLSYKDPSFDKNAFFQQLDKNIEDGTSFANARQKREIAEARTKSTPSWGDFLFLPFLRGQ